MEFSNEHQRRLAMLKAALPYVPPHNKKAMAATPAVYEKLLLNIKDYCTPAESEVVRMLLNFLHADELFKNYRDFAKTHSAVKSEEYSENSTQNFMMEFLMSQLSPQQRTTFEQVSKVMNNKKGEEKVYE